MHQQDDVQDRQTGPGRDIDRPSTEQPQPNVVEEDEPLDDEPGYQFPGDEPGAQGAPMTSDAPASGGAATGGDNEKVDHS